MKLNYKILASMLLFFMLLLKCNLRRNIRNLASRKSMPHLTYQKTPFFLYHTHLFLWGVNIVLIGHSAISIFK